MAEPREVTDRSSLTLVPTSSISAPGSQHVVLHQRRAGAETLPGRADTQDWLGRSQGPGTSVLSPSPSPHPFPSPFLPKGSAGFLPPQGRGTQGEAAANRKSFNFVPFPWHREGRKAAALLIGINTVTPYLLLPNEETWGCSRHLTRKLLVLALGEGPEGTSGTCN